MPQSARDARLNARSVETTWGGLPDAWHALPAGAELCGAVYFLDSGGKPANASGDIVSAMIGSPLWGTSLETYYVQPCRPPRAASAMTAVRTGKPG